MQRLEQHGRTLTELKQKNNENDVKNRNLYKNFHRKCIYSFDPGKAGGETDDIANISLSNNSLLVKKMVSA